MSNTTNISDNIKLIDQIEQVADFKYLGCYLMSTIKEFNKRRIIALKCFWDMKKLWFSKDTPDYLKIRIFKSTVYTF